MPALVIREAKSHSPEVAGLLDELSLELKAKTGRDGTSSFSLTDVTRARSVFLVAFDGDTPVGCGALRPIDNEVGDEVRDSICEVKRMYSRIRGKGVGSEILATLEREAARFKYGRIWLETGVENLATIQFYLKRGYKIRENFGKYRGRAECVCFEKGVGGVYQSSLIENS